MSGQKVGLAGNITVPQRQASASSALSDDAIPTGDPTDVNIESLVGRSSSWPVLDFYSTGRTPPSLEACRWISRGVYNCDREGPESPCEGIWKDIEGVSPITSGVTYVETDSYETIANPLREGHHFDQSLGGIAGLFENMRVNTQASPLDIFLCTLPPR